jgi:PhzF family phenazine biosynthesis protein
VTRQVTRFADIDLVSVFAAAPGGGNPAPIVADATGLSDSDMRAIAAAHGHESAFVLPSPPGSASDLALRFWVPNHEMEMCGHATVGAVWLLDRLGRLPRTNVTIATLSGEVEAQVENSGTAEARIEISQPRGQVAALPDGGNLIDELLSILGIGRTELAPLPVRNAHTSRVKTLIPLKSATILDGLTPDFERIEPFCEKIGSTGLYPYAVCDPENCIFDARQFPKSSGYPEDAATGIAAAALAFGLLEAGQVAADSRPIQIRQGRAMGRPSQIMVRFRAGPDGAIAGCWLGGGVRFEGHSKFALPGN